MTIPRLTGLGDEMRELLPELGQNVMNLINPNNQTQKALYQALMTNPELAQQYANFGAANPQAMESLNVGRHNQALLKGIQESPEHANARQVQKQIGERLKDPNILQLIARAQSGELDAEGKDVSNQRGKVGLKVEEAEAPGAIMMAQVRDKFLKDNPNLANEAAFRQFIGVGREQFDAENQQLQITRQARELAPELLKRNMAKDVKDFLDGKLDTKYAQAYELTPGYGDLWKQLIDAEEQGRQLRSAEARAWMRQNSQRMTHSERLQAYNAARFQRDDYQAQQNAARQILNTFKEEDIAMFLDEKGIELLPQMAQRRNDYFAAKAQLESATAQLENMSIIQNNLLEAILDADGYNPETGERKAGAPPLPSGVGGMRRSSSSTSSGTSTTVPVQNTPPATPPTVDPKLMRQNIVNTVLQKINSGEASAADIDKSSALSAAEKAEIKKRLGVK